MAEDHQTKNALALVDRKAAIMVRDANAGEQLVPDMLRLVTDAPMLDTLGRNVSGMALDNAAEHIVDKVMQLVERNRK